MGKIVNGSASKADALNGPGQCADGSTALPGVNPATTHAQGRCGYGPRLPLLVISPWAKPNFVDHTVTDQSSILRFIEDIFLGGQRIGAGSFDATPARSTPCSTSATHAEEREEADPQPQHRRASIAGHIQPPATKLLVPLEDVRYPRRRLFVLH